jgi:hypothetical protein
MYFDLDQKICIEHQFVHLDFLALIGCSCSQQPRLLM